MAEWVPVIIVIPEATARLPKIVVGPGFLSTGQEAKDKEGD